MGGRQELEASSGYSECRTRNGHFLLSAPSFLPALFNEGEQVLLTGSHGLVSTFSFSFSTSFTFSSQTPMVLVITFERGLCCPWL